MGPMPMIIRAIVAVAGAVDRIFPATMTMPKEMLPIRTLLFLWIY